MPTVQLSERRERLLLSLVQEYIATAQPVSSQRLVEHYDLGLSAATVRNELVALEDAGLVAQPHTSAGRVPTERAYRFYVDALIRARMEVLGAEDDAAASFLTQGREIEKLVRTATDFISKLTDYLALGFSGAANLGRLRRIDLLPLSETRLLVVAITDLGEVLKDTLEFDPGVLGGEAVVAELEARLNSRLGGARIDALSALRNEFVADGALDAAASSILDSLQGMAGSLRDHVYYAGATNILRYPEIDRITREALVGVLESGFSLLSVLSETGDGALATVRIGSENLEAPLKRVSLVAANYGVGDETLGTLGLVGPMRMDYAKAISAVELGARSLSRVLERLLD